MATVARFASSRRSTTPAAARLLRLLLLLLMWCVTAQDYDSLSTAWMLPFQTPEEAVQVAESCGVNSTAILDLGQCLLDRQEVGDDHAKRELWDIMMATTGGSTDLVSTDMLSIWNASVNHCFWPSIECDKDGFVRSLWLADAGIRGTLPPQLTLLDHLQTLDLSRNWISGTLPLAWTRLSTLRSLTLPRFTAGELLPQYSVLTDLRVLDLTDCTIQGTLPPQYSTLTRLSKLYFGNALLHGTLPAAYSTLSSLTAIEGDYTFGLTGTLPTSWSALTDLLFMDFGGTSLSGPLPPQYSALTALVALELSFALLTGTLPPQYSALRSLQRLDLNENGLTGTVPQAWSAMTSLNELNINGNSLTCPPGDATLLSSLPANLQTALTNNSVTFEDPCPAPRQLCGRACAAVLYALGGSAVAVLIAALLMGAYVLVHRARCRNPRCRHRHPGFIHSLGGHFGLEVQSARRCKWCEIWEGQADIAVDPAEVECWLVPERMVGRGAFADVYAAEWRGQAVAVKELRDASAPGALEQFQHEVELGIKYSGSDSIVSLYGASLKPPRLFLITELMTGGTLEERIHGKGQPPLSVLQVLHTARSIAAGLSAMHPEYAHRDLKPANILLDGDGKAKIADMGLGHKSADLLKTEQVMTSAVGTCIYMAPEQIDGEVNAKIDVYSLGLIINEALAREVPFSSYSSSMAVYHAVAAKGERPRLAARAPVRLQRLIRLCWEQSPMHRPSSAEVVCMLDSLIAQELDFQLSDEGYLQTHAGSLEKAGCASTQALPPPPTLCVEPAAAALSPRRDVAGSVGDDRELHGVDIAVPNGIHLEL